MFGHVEVEHSPAMVASMTRTKSPRRWTAETVKKSIETRSRTWLARNVRHVCDGVRERL